MNLRRWLVAGGAALVLLAVLAIPSGSGAAFPNNTTYDGEINNDTAGSNISITKSGSKCYIAAPATIGIRSGGSGSASTAGKITATVTATWTGGSQVVTTREWTSFTADQSIAGAEIDCRATGITVTFVPSGGSCNPGRCTSDTVTGGVNNPYV